MGRVVVVGGGILGCLSALLVAREGFQVVLMERHSRLWTGASATNEGKVHLGPVFALAKQDTHDLLMRSALQFADIIDAAVEQQVDWQALTGDPFDYLVMPGSLLTPDELKTVYRRINGVVPAGARYLGVPIDRVVDPDFKVDAATGLPGFRTVERAVDPRSLGAIVVAAVLAHPSIEVRTGHSVVALRPTDSGGVEPQVAGVPAELFDFAINCAWEQQQSLTPDPEARATLNYRVKSAVRLAPFAGARTVTLVQGPFGDVVRHRDHVYASWYPVARLSNEHGHAPSTEAVRAVDEDGGRRDLGERQVDALRALGLLPDRVEVDEVVGGFILGHGALDIDSRQSLLHDRSQSGVLRQGRVLTPINFKLTGAPLAARGLASALRAMAGLAA